MVTRVLSLRPGGTGVPYLNFLGTLDLDLDARDYNNQGFGVRFRIRGRITGLKDIGIN
jgi:hypothetical protein